MFKEGTSEFGESFDRVASELRESFDRVQDTLVFKRLSLCEAYIEGRARIAVEFCAHPVREANGSRLIAVWKSERNFPEATASRFAPRVQEIEAFDLHDRISSDENVMLVGDVEPVEGVEIIPSVLEGLYRVEDEVLNGLTWRTSTMFMSVEGTFRGLPILMEGKECVPVDFAAVGFHKGAVCMVEGCSEIVYGIANNRGRMGGNAASEHSAFPTLRIGLGAQGFQVVSNVGPHNSFKLVDVMVGPFYF